MADNGDWHENCYTMYSAIGIPLCLKSVGDITAVLNLSS